MSNVQDFPYYESTHILICIFWGCSFINAPLLSLKMIIFNLTTLTTLGFILSIGTVFIKITHLVRFNTRMSRRFRKRCKGVIHCTKNPTVLFTDSYFFVMWNILTVLTKETRLTRWFAAFGRQHNAVDSNASIFKVPDCCHYYNLVWQNSTNYSKNNFISTQTIAKSLNLHPSLN